MFSKAAKPSPTLTAYVMPSKYSSKALLWRTTIHRAISLNVSSGMAATKKAFTTPPITECDSPSAKRIVAIISSTNATGMQIAIPQNKAFRSLPRGSR